jgi:hypothetical protein
MSSPRSPRSSRSSSRGWGGLRPGPAGAFAFGAARPLVGALRLAPSAVSDAGLQAGAALLVSRMLVWVAGLWAIVLFGVNPALNAAMDFAHVTTPFDSHAANLMFAPTIRWDSVWYLYVAHSGYTSQQTTAFFPLLPLLLRSGGAVLGSPVLAGALVSSVATVCAGVCLFRLARCEIGARGAAVTVTLVAVFPTSLFLSAIYTEALFLALSVAACYAARRERWAVAGLLGALAAMTRASGVLLVIALGLMYLYGPREGGVAARRSGRLAPRFAVRGSIAWLALVPAGLIAYCAYLAVKLGTPFAPFQAEHIWQRSFAGPFGAVVHALGHAPVALRHVLDGTQRPFGLGSPLGWDAYQLIDLPFLAFALVGLWHCWRRLPFAYFAYALVLCAQALSYPTPVEPLESFSRYLIVMFPIFMGWGAWLATRPRARALTYTVLAAGLVAFSALWAVSVWVA